MKGSVYLDVSITHTLAQSHLQRAASGQLEGSKIRYEQKITKYLDLGSSFKPLVLESTGGWHPSSFNTLKLLASKMATNTGKLPNDILNVLLTTCSIRLQRSQGS